MKTSEAVLAQTTLHEDQLRTLIAAFRLVSVSLDQKEILGGILRAAKKLISYDAAGIFVFDPVTRTLRGHELIGYESGIIRAEMCCSQKGGIIGRVLETGAGVVVRDVSTDPDYIRAREETQSELAAPIIGSGDVTIGVINLESDLPHAYTEIDLQLLQMFAGMVAVAIEKANLHRELVEKRRLEYELRVASQLMGMLMPTCPPEVKNFSICGRSVPSAAVGGDYFDFIDVGDGRWGLVIADVSGKGIPAALIMASFRAYLQALVSNDFSLRGVFYRLNRLLMKTTEARHFVTAFFARFDPEERRIFYVNAGHNPPLLIRPGEPPQVLSRGGIPLGIFDSVAYTEDVAYFHQGDILVMYTDGITESTDAAGRVFGLQQLVSLVRTHAEESAGEICQKIVQEVQHFSAPDGPADDLTIVVVRAD
ncbi:MAG: SpoIIE family protein phosphatase [Acidobacteria bacterium]|nr:SpoIIE family protein phosphatase [Acidobacteriota bacterium]